MQQTIQKEHKILQFLSLSLFLIGIGLFLIGYIEPKIIRFNIMMTAVLILFIGNILYGMNNFKKHYIFIFFQIALFTFLIVNPLILMFRGVAWWDYYTHESEEMAQIALFLTLVFMRLGAFVGNEISKKREANKLSKNPSTSILRDEEFARMLRLLCYFGLAITFVASLLVGVEKVTFMKDKSYYDYYVLYESQLPGVIVTLASLTKYFVCLFLATRPTKKMSILVLVVYILLALFDFIVGIRNPVVLRVLLALIYFIYRNHTDEKKWIGTKEKVAIVIATPVILAFLGLYVHIREGEDVDMNLIEAIINFFAVLGASYSFLCLGFMTIPRILKNKSAFFTLAPAYEYIFHGSFAQMLGAVALESGNTELRALQGWNFSHLFAYFADKDHYLSGGGYGSSYLLETYADFGWVGIIAFSIILGMLLILLVDMLRSNILLRCISLVALCDLFFSPRAEATGWMTFIIYVQFWAVVLLFMFAAALLYKNYSFGKYKKRRSITS